MIKKMVLVLFAACTALVLVPTVSASAATSKGFKERCFGIEKAGRYAFVRAAISGRITPGNAKGFGRLSISSQCPRTNAVPIVRLHVYSVQLRSNGSGRILSETSHGISGNRSGISMNSPATHTPCNYGLRADFRISYTYYDGSRVRPFYVHSKPFVRC